MRTEWILYTILVVEWQAAKEKGLSVTNNKHKHHVYHPKVGRKLLFKK